MTGILWVELPRYKCKKVVFIKFRNHLVFYEGQNSEPLQLLYKICKLSLLTACVQPCEYKDKILVGKIIGHLRSNSEMLTGLH